MSIGAQLIAEERWKQEALKGFSAAHDDAHTDNELINAAYCYMHANGCLADWLIPAPDYWPWEKDAWRPSEDPVRNLVKAGALIAAEIDRIHRTNECKDNKDAAALAQENMLMRAALGKIASATRIDGGNPEFMEWSDMKVLAQQTLNGLG